MNRSVYPELKNKFIVVEGVIGVGKTTLAKHLSSHLSAQLFLEIVEENPFLKDFYDDITGKAFQTQLFFLLSRYKQFQQLHQIDMFHHTVISDYMFMKDEIFAQLTLSETELQLYNNIFSLVQERVIMPDLVIYLYADLSVILQRIAHRDRSFEQNIQPAYLSALRQKYDDFFAGFTGCPVLQIDTTACNFLTSVKQFDKLIMSMRKMLQ